MKTIIRGRIVGQEGKVLTNIGVELWGIDDQGNLSGTEAFLKTATLSGGDFRLDLRFLPELPVRTCVILRDRGGQEVGRVNVTPAILDGHMLYHEMPQLAACTTLSVWPSAYTPLKRIPESVKGHLSLVPQERLVLENAPEVSYFSAYCYLAPSPQNWPWPVDAGELGGQSLEQRFLLGAQVNYRQVWSLLGHARGELLHSIPLAPGEEATFEILNWDRNIFKREDEITDDLERQVEQNRQWKDSHEVQREMRETSKWHVSLKGDVSILWVKVSADPAGYETEVQDFSKDVRNTILDATDRASSKIHSQRKTVIASTREFGREEKVTRKITNTNRAHTVTYHFFEVLRNYQIETAIYLPARPCVFVKQSHPFVRNKLLAEPYEYDSFLEALRWLHVNSHVIARGLLDRSLYKGLELLPEMQAYWMLHRGAAVSGIDIDIVLRPVAQRLVTAVENISSIITDPMVTDDWALVKLADVIGRLMPWVLDKVIGGPGSLKYFLEHPDPNQENELQQAVADFLNIWDVTFPQTSDYCRDIIEWARCRPYFLDHIITLRSEYAKWVYGPTPGEEPTAEELARMQDVAEVMRLMRHIEQHYVHYFQLIWADKGAGERLLEASNTVLPGNVRLIDVIDNDLLGFCADYAVFPFKGEVADSALGRLIQGFESLPEETKKPAYSEVVLPSNGIVVEPQLGEYTACEPFIEQHREYDLHLKELEVQKARLENQRRLKKIQVCELDNPECCPSQKYGFFSRLFHRCRQDPKSEAQQED